MSTPKKTRGDSVLGSLTGDRQTEIAEHALAHTLKETLAWLKADGIRISSGNLSRWLSSWQLSQVFQRSEDSAQEFKTWLAKEQPALSEEQLDQRAALMFQFEAVKAGDAETWLAIASARQKGKHDAAKLALQERQFNLDREKFELDVVARARESAKEIRAIEGNHKLSESAKITAIRQRLFGALPETPNPAS